MLDKSKQIGADWKGLTDKEKEPFNLKAAEDKKRFDKEKANYKPPAKDSDSSSDDGPKKKRAKKEKDPNAPKRNVNAYMHFAAEKRVDLKKSKPELKPTEITTQLGASWAKMNDTEKQPYTKLAAADKARYDEEMKKYKPGKK